MCDLFTDVQIRHDLAINILGLNERPLIFFWKKKRGGGWVVCFSEPETELFVRNKKNLINFYIKKNRYLIEVTI